jgi:hypothetical protein
MKSLFGALLPVVLLLSCKKSSDSNGSNTAFTGQWKWVSTVWNVGPTNGTTTPPSSGLVTLTLNTDNTYVAELNGAVKASGTYHIDNTGESGTAFQYTLRISHDSITVAGLGICNNTFILASPESLTIGTSLNPGANSLNSFVRYHAQ